MWWHSSTRISFGSFNLGTRLHRVCTMPTVQQLKSTPQALNVDSICWQSSCRWTTNSTRLFFFVADCAIMPSITDLPPPHPSTAHTDFLLFRSSLRILLIRSVWYCLNSIFVGKYYLFPTPVQDAETHQPCVFEVRFLRSFHFFEK